VLAGNASEAAHDRVAADQGPRRGGSPRSRRSCSRVLSVWPASGPVWLPRTRVRPCTRPVAPGWTVSTAASRCRCLASASCATRRT